MKNWVGQSCHSPPAMLTSGLTSPFVWLNVRLIQVVLTAIRTLLILTSVTVGLIEVSIRMLAKIDYKGWVAHHPCHVMENILVKCYIWQRGNQTTCWSRGSGISTSSENVVVAFNEMLERLNSGQSYLNHKQYRKGIRCVTESTFCLSQGSKWTGRPIICSLERLKDPIAFVPKTGPVMHCLQNARLNKK